MVEDEFDNVGDSIAAVKAMCVVGVVDVDVAADNDVVDLGRCSIATIACFCNNFFCNSFFSCLLYGGLASL